MSDWVKKNILILAFFMGLILFIVFLHWNNANVPLTRDEGEYAYSASLLRSGSFPYEHSFLQKPPLIIYTYLFSQLGGRDFWPPRVLSYIFVFLSTLILFFALRKEKQPKVAYIMVWFIPLLVLLPNFDQFTANTEMFMVLPLAGLVSLYLSASRKLSEENIINKWPLFFAGSLGAVLFLYKYNILPLVIFIYLFWLYEIFKRNKKFEKLIKAIFFMASGFIPASLIILSPFLFHDRGAALWETTVKFNSYYAQSVIFGGEAIKYYAVWFLSHWWMLFFVSLFFFLQKTPRKTFYAGLLLMSILGTYGSGYGHYYIFFAFLWSIVIAFSLDNLAVFLAEKIVITEEDEKGVKERKKINPDKARVILTGAALLISMISIFPLILNSRANFEKEKLAGNPFLEAVTAAQKISRLSRANDYILVAGSEPEILYYTQRKSSTRFDIFYPLMINTPLALPYQKEAVSEIEKNPPRIIVYVNSYNSWTSTSDSPKIITEFLDNLLKEKYDLIEEENEIAIYQEK